MTVVITVWFVLALFKQMCDGLGYASMSYCRFDDDVRRAISNDDGVLSAAVDSRAAISGRIMTWSAYL